MHSYFAEIMHGIEAVARSSNYQIVIGNTEEHIAREVNEVEALRVRTDGLIIATCATASKTELYKKMIADGTKIVLIDRTLEGLECPMVTTDDIEVGLMGTEHLIRLGHRKIGHLRGTTTSTSKKRLEGYKQALEKNDIAYEKSLVRTCGLMESDGYRVMNDWIREGSLPKAIFAVNDPTAIGAMQALHEAGIRVGKNVAIVGGGNIHYGDMLRVPLTTVSWSSRRDGPVSDAPPHTAYRRRRKRCRQPKGYFVSCTCYPRVMRSERKYRKIGIKFYHHRDHDWPP